MASHVLHNGAWIEIRHGTRLGVPQAQTRSAPSSHHYPAAGFTRIPYYGPGYPLQPPNPTIGHVTQYIPTWPPTQPHSIRQNWYGGPTQGQAAQIAHPAGPGVSGATQIMNNYSGLNQAVPQGAPRACPQPAPLGYTGMSANGAPLTGGVYVMGSETYRHILGQPPAARTVHPLTPGANAPENIPWFVSKEDYDVDRAVRNDWNTWAQRYHGTTGYGEWPS